MPEDKKKVCFDNKGTQETEDGKETREQLCPILFVLSRKTKEKTNT